MTHVADCVDEKLLPEGLVPRVILSHRLVRHLCVLSLPAKRLVRNSGKYCFQCVCKASLATGIEGAQKCKDSREPARSRRTPFPLPSCSVCPVGQKGKVKSRPKTLHTGEKGELDTAAMKKQNQTA